MKNFKKQFIIAFSFLTAFCLWTTGVLLIDLQPIGPNASCVGFATVNQYVHRLTDVHMWLYTLTDWLSLIPLLFIFSFGLLGLLQWIRRKSIRKVDCSILLLGGFYILVMAFFVAFEVFEVNYRPILIEGILEASYPSSTTMLVICVMTTTVMQLNHRIRHPRLKKITVFTITCFSLFMVIGRLISGVHWFTDIIAGILLSVGLIKLYQSACTLCLGKI